MKIVQAEVVVFFISISEKAITTSTSIQNSSSNESYVTSSFYSSYAQCYAQISSSSNEAKSSSSMLSNANDPGGKPIGFVDVFVSAVVLN
jgi:hypothetical protein